MGLPAPLEGLDDTDQLIYDYRFRQHLSLRAISAHVGLSHEAVRLRIRKFVPLLRPEDHERLRDEEGIGLNEQRAMAMNVAATTQDEATAVKALGLAHAITRTLITLYGLERQHDDTPADPDKINDLLAAFTAGAVAATPPSD